MGIYDAIKEGIKIVQATDNTPLIKNYMDIQKGYMELMGKLEEANNKIKDLEERVKNNAKYTLSEKGYYEEEGSKIKYCSRCYEVDNKVVSLHENTMRTNGIYYVCPQCKTEVLKEKKDVAESIRKLNINNKMPTRNKF